MDVLYPKCAGLDVHLRTVVACVRIGVDGWPITHHVFRGNGRDAMTVPQVLTDLEQRFGLRRIVFVGDRGMVTSANVDLLSKGADLEQPCPDLSPTRIRARPRLAYLPFDRDRSRDWATR